MIDKKLISLANAIAEHEGWLPPNYTNDPNNGGSISYRLNNPGNLRRSPFSLGTHAGFAYFFNEDIGWFALLWDLYQKCTGNTSSGLSPKSTLGDLISVYAPPTENNTQAYIKNIEEKTGIDRDTLLETLVK